VRAQSFGSIAAAYDQYRPTYAEAMFDDLAALRPAAVLDVGCGTGMVADGLARRGLEVLGIEPDEQMAAVARARGLTVEVSGFEAWDDGGRQFDLLTCGASWHWIDPVAGAKKAALVVRPGGTLARCWNFAVPQASVESALEPIYAALAPDAFRYVPCPTGSYGASDPLATTGAFDMDEPTTYVCDRTLDATAWVQMMSTMSDHQRLGPERLAALGEAITSAINDLGGTVQISGGTFVSIARRR
jgi:SAM-dependent methyltransferase